MNTLDEPIDLLFYGHHGSALGSGTDSPVNLYFTRPHHRGPSPDASQCSNDDSSDGMNPELSAMAATTAPLSKTTTTKTRTSNTGTVRYSVIVEIDQRGSDSNVFYDASANPASTEIPAFCSNTPPPHGKQSYPTFNLHSGIFQSGQHTERGTNMEKVSRLPTSMAVNSNGKCGREAMNDAGEPNSQADTAEPLKKIVRTLPTENPSPPNSPPLLTSNQSDDEGTAAAEQILIETSVQHLLTLASETEQPPS